MIHFKRIIAGILLLFSYAAADAQCTTLLLHDDYSNPSLWTSVVSYPGEIDISGGTLNYTNLEGAAYDRVFRSLPSTLPDTYWNATCDFMPVSGNGPGHYVMAFTAGSLDPMSYDGSLSYAATNEDAIMVYLLYVGPTPTFGCCTDPSSGTWQLIARSKKGTVLATPSPGISVPSLNQYVHVRLERLAPGIVAMHGYSDAAMTMDLPGSPVYYCIDPTITGLNTINQGVLTGAGYIRTLSAKIDNLNICLSQPSDTTRVAGCIGTNISLQAQNIASATYTWSPAVSCSTCSTASVPTPVSGTVNYSVFVTAGCASFVQYFSVTKDTSSACAPPGVCVFSAGPDTAVCAGSTVQLYSTAGFNSYHWSPGAGLSDSTIANPIATVVDATSYTVTATQGTGGMGPNLFPNGDFSAGNTGFTSDLLFTSIYGPGDYDIAPTFFTTSYATSGDHTPTSDGMFMSVDGANTLEALWQGTASITPSTNYSFSFWCTDGNVNVPQFEIHCIGNVTGDQLIATMPGILGAPAPAVYWTWSQYNPPVWNSGANTSVTVKVINTELNGYGNDFGLDDFSLQTTSSSVCIGTDTVNLAITPPPPLPLTQDTSYCEGTATLPLHAAGTNILWYASAGSSIGSPVAPTPSSAAAGQTGYYVTQTVNGCESDTATVHVTILDSAPDFKLDPTQPPCSQKTMPLGPVNAAWQYLWMDGDTLSPRVATNTGMYILTASNPCGSSTDSVELVFEDCHCYFYLPNAFTPNSNGTNDLFMPKHDCLFDTYRMSIYDRWGEKIFDTTDPLTGWDGTYHGNPVELGVYVVHIDYNAKDESGYFNPKSVLGSVTVVR